MAELYIGNNQIGGGTPDLSNYYNKSEIDSSFGETYLVKITNSAGYYCYVPRTMSDADRQIILSKLNTNGGIVKTASSTSAFIGNNSNSEGYNCQAINSYSHAEGSGTVASGEASHAEGRYTQAQGMYSHAEGFTSRATDFCAHAEGYNTNASGYYSHTEGDSTVASGWYSHAEGFSTNAKAEYQHVEGKYNSDAANSILIIGNGTASTRHNALEVHLSGDVKISDTYATGEAYEKPLFVLQDKLYQIDSSITALEANSGGTPDLSGYYTKSEIDDLIPTVPTALSSFTNDTGYVTNNDTSIYALKSEVDSSFGETYLVKISNASGYFCYVPRTMSDADRQIILSKLTKNGGVVKFAYPNSTIAQIGTNSNSAGYYTRASGDYSHAEGSFTNASGPSSHAQGNETTASGNYSHAEGNNTTASGSASHAEGYFTNAKESYQHAEGKFNADAANSILIVGNGISQNPHNALEVHLSGEVKISDTHASGEVYEKPMFVLQDKLYQIDSSITALEANPADLTDYYTKSEVDDLIPTVPTAISSFTNDSGFITNNDTSVYALKSELPTVPTAISSFTNDTGYVTNNDTSIYALKSELPTVPTALSSFTNDTGFITNNDTSVYALKSELPTVPTALSSFTNDTGFITNNDISTFVTASSVYDKNYIDTSLNSIESRLNNSSSQQVSFRVLTQAQYSALTPDSNTIYFITN